MINLQSPNVFGFSAKRLERIKPVMQSYVDNAGYAGIVTMLARRGQVIYFDKVGWQDRENKVPMGLDAIFRIYSMTKPIICTALMLLHEEGRFQLADPLAKFLPAFGKVKVLVNDTSAGWKEVAPIRPITVGDLFTHTAGLTYNFLEDSPVGEQYRQANLMGDGQSTLQQVIAELARFPLAFQPGSKWHYSMSIDVLAHLIEVISGQALQDFLQTRFFDPLGMVDTAFQVPADKRHRLAAMYGHPDIAQNKFSDILAAWMAGKNGRQEVEATYPSHNAPHFARGGHGLFSTAADYMRFAQMLLNRGKLDSVRLLAPKTIDFMHMNHLPAKLLPFEISGIPRAGYGFGLGSRVLLNVAESGLPGSVGEYGWAGAARTHYWVDPQEEVIGVMMAQFMIGVDFLDKDFQTLAYQAMVE